MRSRVVSILDRCPSVSASSPSSSTAYYTKLLDFFHARSAVGTRGKSSSMRVCMYASCGSVGVVLLRREHPPPPGSTFHSPSCHVESRFCSDAIFRFNPLPVPLSYHRKRSPSYDEVEATTVSSAILFPAVATNVRTFSPFPLLCDLELESGFFSLFRIRGIHRPVDAPMAGKCSQK